MSDLKILRELETEMGKKLKNIEQKFVSSENIRNFGELKHIFEHLDNYYFLIIGEAYDCLDDNLDAYFLDGDENVVGLFLDYDDSELPRQLFNLFNINFLAIFNSEIKELPKEISELKNLNSLFVVRSEIKELPKEILELNNLQYLDLSSNKLSELPKEISQLNNLQYLDLSSNQLSKLPKQITLLNMDIKWEQYLINKAINLYNNPLESPPIEIVKKGRQAVIDFFRQLEDKEKDHLYEAKFIIIGEPGAGKTTLSKKIINPDYELEDIPSTEGIDVLRWQFNLENGQPFFMNIWDFGGQEIYHATHQFFLTKRSLYVLVADARKENTDFHYWLDIVSLLSEKSPLLIIKNEKQDRMPNINEPQLRGLFTNLKDIFPANLKTNRGLDAVLHAIKHHIRTLPHIGSALPKTWVNVRKALENDSRNYISLDDYLKICDENGFDLYKDKLQLSGYLHDLGVCLHFQDDPVLKQKVILKPEWGTGAVYKVLDHNPVKQNFGKFTQQDLTEIWDEEQYQGMEDELLQLMIKFQLCYEIPDKKGHYIAPQLLSFSQPDYHWNASNNMFLRYTYDFMPKGIITRFIVIMHKFIEEQTYVWRSGVILGYENTRAEIIEYYPGRKITIRVSGHEKKYLMSIVMHELDKIHDSYHGLKFDKLIPCHCSECVDSQEPYFFKYKSLIKRKEKRKLTIECDHSYEDVNVRRLIDGISHSPHSPEILKPKKPSKPAQQNKIFISYSHKDEAWKDRLTAHLNVLKRQDLLDFWEDRQILPGGDWYQDIQTAITKAQIAILLISVDFLNSEFILNEELPVLLQKRQDQGLTIIPVIVEPCLWEDVSWLSPINVLPKDGTPPFGL